MRKVVIELIRTFNMSPPQSYFGLELDVGLIQIFGWHRKKSLQLCAVLLSIVFICVNGGLALVSLSEWTAHSEAGLLSSSIND